MNLDVYINDLAFSVSNFNLNSLNENCILMKILLLTIIQLPDRQMTTICQPYYINYILLYMFYIVSEVQSVTKGQQNLFTMTFFI